MAEFHGKRNLLMAGSPPSIGYHTGDFSLRFWSHIIYKCTDKVSNNINLNNDMLAQAKIVVDEKRVLTYLLEKIYLWD